MDAVELSLLRKNLWLFFGKRQSNKKLNEFSYKGIELSSKDENLAKRNKTIQSFLRMI